MASRIAATTLRASIRSRAANTLPRAIPSVASRSLATSSEKNPDLIEKLPSSPGLISKTGTAVLGTGILAAAISNEIYVFNAETVVAAGTLILFTAIGRYGAEPYKNWADAQIKRIRDTLQSARDSHTQAVKDRIQSVEQMKDVVSLTEGLFALSKETAKLESEAFVQQQKVALATELKSVLDSWVRYEQQVKESEQADLAKTVIDKVMATLKDEKTQKDIIASALAEVDQLVKSKAI